MNRDLPEQDETARFFAAARARRRRGIEQFAEEEIVIPSGPFEGRRFSCDRQPFARHLFRAMDSGWWKRFIITGPSQSGKTLCGSVTPVLYHLFERKEDCGYAVPSLDMVKDKWKQDLRTVIERSRYRDFLPKEGAGSKGGTPTAIEFLNGVTLRFFTGGGDDKSRAGFTVPALVVTEADGFQEIGTASRESTKLKQLEARTNSYGGNARIYYECTVSTETGFTWATYKSGTESRLALPCPHCGEFVTPERDHFKGWQEAQNIKEAAEWGRLYCPACDRPWSDQQRFAANHAAVVVHRGQTIDRSGRVSGEPPITDTLGFRWTMANNLLWDQGRLAVKEWNNSREIDDEAADLEMRQFYWALPAVPKVTELTTLSAHGLTTRTARWPRGLVPAEAQAFTLGCDLGKRLGHWFALATMPGAVQRHVVDYGKFDVPSDEMPVEVALLIALRAFREVCEAGWAWEDAKEPRQPEQVWIDSGYMTDVVYAFVRESGDREHNRYRACKGYGETDGRLLRYNKPTKTSNDVALIGEQYHFTLDRDAACYRVDVNADHWKTVLQDGLGVPLQSPPLPGTITLFNAMPREHLGLAKHLTAEKKVEEFVPGRGMVQRWERIKRSNHHLDAGYLSCAAAHHCGVRSIETDSPAQDVPEESVPEQSPLSLPDGRPFLATER